MLEKLNTVNIKEKKLMKEKKQNIKIKYYKLKKLLLVFSLMFCLEIN